MIKNYKKTPLILGFNGSHDGSAALIEGGKILGTISRERITRIKKCSDGNNQLLINQLLLSCSRSLEEIDYVAFCDNYLNPQQAYLLCKDEDGIVRPKSNIYGELRPDLQTTATFQSLYTEINNQKIPCFFINHHLGHIAYSLFTSKFSKSICLSMDGSPAEYALLALASGNKINPQRVNDIDVSLVYDWLTYYTLGNPLFKAGSMMGLSAYGKPSNIIDIKQFTQEHIELSWRKLTNKDPIKVEYKTEKISPTDILTASTLQYLFEKKIINYLNNIPEKILKNNKYNLCLSGGTFLNCKVNGLLKDNTKFKNIHIAPASSDDGLSVGAALYTAHSILNLPRTDHKNRELMYSGPSYAYSSSIGIAYDEDIIIDLIMKGKVVGLFQGKSEFGPRALGNRSLLADPRCKQMRDHLNKNIKKREWFRPFGATVLLNEAKNWFKINSDESPYMLKTYKVIKPKKIPAVTHIDGSSRIQTLDYKTNPKFYSLIKKFYLKTGVPILLNTSLNDSNEPIVETPENAITFFYKSKIDALILEDRMLLRNNII